MRNLEPKALWENFYSLTQIPRPSGKRKEISDFLYNYGLQLGLETVRDEIGNVIIRKPASAGYENHPGVILQGHMDMVPQKNNDVQHDFEKDPIRAYVEDNKEWVTADGTTLGADNGIGVAVAMTILADKNVVHPPLEAFFSIDEETGMYGANALAPQVLQGKYLLNLDSEVEGELCIGCAGGIDATARFAFQPVDVEEGDIAMKVVLTGLKGGHSGCDIQLQRANANKLMFRFLKQAVSEYEARLVSVCGGNMRNAIPRDAEAVVTIPAEGKEEFIELVDEWEDLFIKQYDGVEDGIRFTTEEVECPKQEMPEDVQDFLIHAVTICPSGVYRVQPELPELVETSNNLSIITTENNQVSVLCLARSNDETRKRELVDVLSSVFSLAGADIEFTGDYPGWTPNVKSSLLQLMKQVYNEEFGITPRSIAMHAGLECGIIGGKYPGMEMVSFGPTIEHPHSPDERVNIATVQKFYKYVLAILKKV